MTPETKAELTAAFEHFGPEFVSNALRVRDLGEKKESICQCFVGYGYIGLGTCNDRLSEFTNSWTKAANSHSVFAYSLSGNYEAGGKTREELFTLAEEWLEQNRTKAEVCTLTLQG